MRVAGSGSQGWVGCRGRGMGALVVSGRGAGPQEWFGHT